MRLTEAQQRTIWLWRLNSRGTTPDAYALHESEMIDAGITETGRGARMISNGLIRRGLAVEHSHDGGLLLLLTPAGVDVLDRLVGYRTKRQDDVVWCACKPFGPVHAYEPGESCSPNDPAPRLGDDVEIRSGDYHGRRGGYDGVEDATGEHRVYLDSAVVGDPPVLCDRVRLVDPADRRRRPARGAEGGA
ncbi:hypothetical protein SK069_05835 [Patulibacter brassicae]|uniref:Uncharacterized protein n=1 Tax=Patulibacter brassicae TaxID=1705717 RepID=A0ABU4VH15_9ACTN|nr:hypothetical protein [Patulibacter brassicae]MDX8151105.1 hypothetical protein [Patulibacter brassicae]